ncbi:MAG: preprotein translocase subunit SecY [Anaerolineales bacterium]|uniref:Protein translocase subunit SecY n=1 Tax=Candidatus Desulfolinea nitratireducens TaxID=2841698 RepID=A0A8J6NLL3_9CHLR|nr:preprotein translocase subunit SecY [Candidatus Desulfolinea nitratireducens]MBL6960609.1 preprotein translocase subunit SecY [Anaerolineales bacterium]
MKQTFSGWRYLWTSIDIRRKLLYTLGFLALYRVAANVPAPGVDFEALAAFRANLGASGTFFNFLDLLSGGTVSQFSLLSMGVYPYITAQIILQLLTPIIPALQQRMKDDPREGQKWMEKWTYILAVPMAALSAIGQVNIFNSYAQQLGLNQILPFGFSSDLILSSITVLVAMTGGTMFAIWLGELISEYGMRKQGLSLIIFAGIVVNLPSNLVRLMSDEQNRWVLLAMTIVVLVLTIFAIVFVQQGRRNVPVMYPGRRMGNRMSMPVKGTLPLMVNMAGMIPLIFSSAILQFPAIVSSYFVGSETPWIANFAKGAQSTFDGSGGVYWLLYFLMVVIFTFFYTDVLFAQQNYGDNLKRMGAQIPGISRGAPTQKYLTKVQRRITLPGALFLGLVAVLPYLMQFILPISSQGAGLLLVSSAGLLIVVGVVRDVFQNIDAELKLHGYQDSILVK